MGTMWRPTLRCDSVYREYVESLSECTSLDKNQIIRLMMFVAAHSEEFKQIIAEYRIDNTKALPCAAWKSWQDVYWLNQTYKSITPDATTESHTTPTFTVKGKGEGIKLDLRSTLF